MMSHINFENFYDEVKFYCHGQPKKASGLGEIITGIDHPLADVWINYALDKGWPKRAEFFRKMLVQGSSLTMPCADPRKFDPTYCATVRRKAFQPEHVTSDPEMRKRIVDEVMSTMRAAKLPHDPYRKSFEQPKAKPPTLAELAAMPTPAPSPALRKILGLPDQEAAKDETQEGERAA